MTIKPSANASSKGLPAFFDDDDNIEDAMRLAGRVTVAVPSGVGERKCFSSAKGIPSKSILLTVVFGGSTLARFCIDFIGKKFKDIKAYQVRE